MADLISGASDAVISVALNTLISEIQRVYGEIRGVKKELHRLTEKLKLIQKVLEDAETKQFQDKAVQEWLWRLRDLAYDAEDILEEWATKAQKQDDESQSRITKLCKYILPQFKLKFRCYIAKKIKEIKERFDEIKEQSSEFHLMERVANTRRSYFGESSRDPTDSLVDSSKTRGRDNDKKIVIESLLNDINNEKDVFVLPIVGMGGIGKTSLAKLVYNDPQIVGHFNQRMWVCVSDNFELIRLTSAIFQSATGTKSDLVELDPLQESLRDKLKEKFLLVLDDVWNEDREKWQRLKGILNCSKGSAIIVTTRSESIASMMGSRGQYYKLKGLTDDYCWSLFEHCAFGGESGEESPKLVAIGKQIVKKCGGLPLAVNALGSLLSYERDEEKWRIIGDSEILKLPNVETGILPALRLSYDHLPFQLRRCFAYCSIFPKDYKINKEILIYQWMANDFILPKPPSMELEDVGNQIFNELVRRSLLQVEDRNRRGKIISCKMHDLLHDLARFVTGSEFFTLVENAGELDCVPKETRHLFFAGKIIHKSLWDAQKVRGLFLATDGESLDFNQNISNLRWVRCLDLSKCHINELPSSIGNLLHLRYLDLSWNDFTTLPESINNLQNLQTLLLICCEHLTTFPKGTRKMSRLKHLDITGCYELMDMPNKIGQLTSLQKLPMFMVGEGSEGGISQLGDLNLIRGELSIMHLERVRNGMESQEAKLFKKKNLRFLKLSWAEDLDDRDTIESEETLKNLQPCAELEELEILRYPGKQFSSSWLKASLLPNLAVVDLDGCYNCQNLPPLGQLPCLKHLRIEAMHAVKRIGFDFYGEDKSKSFPSLQEFEIKGMDNLEEWSFVEDKRKVFPSLNKLSITNLEKLNYFPKGLLRECTMLETLELDECKKLRTLGPELNSLVALKSLTIYSSEEMECLSKEGIRGLSCLRKLNIMRCSALTTISPVLEELPSLKKLHIEACDHLMSMPGGIGKLVHLESLSIDSCFFLTSFPQEGIEGLTSLQKLKLKLLPKLTSLPEGIGGLTSLKNLVLMYLRELTSLPEGIEGLTSLKNLVLTHLRELTSLPEGIVGLTSLHNLELFGLPQLTSLPKGIEGLTSLKELIIGGCPKLSILPATLQRLTTLKKLGLQGFDNVNFLGGGGFPSLEELIIEKCENLTTSLFEEEVLQGLTALQLLEINFCYNLISLPEEGVRGLTALQVLHISCCKKLSSLPVALQQLISLRELRITGSDNLTSLPEEGVQGLTALKMLQIWHCSKFSKLPTALQELSIQSLTIKGCDPELMRQVEGKTGEEWLKIKHIPHFSTRRYF